MKPLSKVLNRVADNLYRTGEGTYYARLRYLGKDYKASLGTHDRKTADRKLKDFQNKIENEHHLKPDITFKDASDKWIESLYALKPMSRLRRETSLKAILPTFGEKMLREINKAGIEAWARLRLQKVKPRTFNQDRDTFNRVMEYGQITLQVITSNPVSTVKKLKAAKPLIVPPTKEQFKELIAYLDKSKSKEAAPFVKFLAYSGMRLDEAHGVLWQHIDFAAGTLLVAGGQYGTKNYRHRSLPLFEPLRELLTELAKNEHKATDRVFTILSAKNALQWASKAIGLPKGEHFTHHDMRHFFCSNCIEAGIDFATIAGWLGHQDGGKLVAGTYGHLRAGHSAEMAKKITFKA